MAWNDFETNLVAVPPGGGVLRTHAAADVKVFDGITGAPVQLRQDGRDVTTLRADASGWVTFQALDSLLVRVESLGQSQLVESAQQKQAKGTFAGDLDAAVDGGLDRAEADGRLLSPDVAASTYATHTVVAGKVGKGDLLVNVKDYGAVGDGVADDTAAIQAAGAYANSRGRVIYFPAGNYRFSTTLTAFRNVRGDGRGRSFLTYTGTGTAIQLANSIGTRSFHGLHEGYTLQSAGSSPVIGLDLESHSVGLFSHIAVSGFQTGIRLWSTVVDGACVYNTFVSVEANDCAVGWAVGGLSSNENRFLACRTNLASQWGWRISGGNHNILVGCAVESGVGGIQITETENDSGRNQIILTRFENNTGNAVNIASTVVNTAILYPDIVSTGGSVVDDGKNTSWIISSAGAGTELVRRKGMGSDPTPQFAVRDTYTPSGSPVTVEIENARFGGKFVRCVQGGEEVAAITGDGMLRPRATATSGRKSAANAGAGAMAYDSTLRKPIWSDGTAWRDATGTAV